MIMWYDARMFKPRDKIEVYLIFEDREIRQGYYSFDQRSYICQEQLCDPYVWSSIPLVQLANIDLHRSRGSQNWGVMYKSQKKKMNTAVREDWTYEI